MIETVDVIVRVGGATAAGALVGLEREAHGQLAGMRTHALVAIGACLFTLIGAYGFPDQPRSENVDPMRVAAQVVSGIGFIGAGAIIRDRGAIRGVTTAAALWASAALGMAAAAGLLVETALGLAAILFALVGLRALRERVLRTQQSIAVTYRRGHGTLGPLIDAVEAGGGQLERLSIDDEDQHRHVVLNVRTRDRGLLQERVGTIGERPEVLTLNCG